MCGGRMSVLYYATGNHDKFETVAQYMQKNAPQYILRQCAHELIEIQSYDQKEIALDKARQAWNFLKQPVLVDDAGIYFEKYNRFPGVLTKYVYMGLGLEGLLKLVEPGDRAFFCLHLIYWYGPEQYEIFHSDCFGTIVHQNEYQATEHSPYNALFIPDGSNKTLAELKLIGDYEQHDYRIRALKKFLAWHASQ